MHTFLGIVNVCVKHKLCKLCPSRGVWGHAPQNSCPEIESGGFWQLADSVFKITTF